MCRNLMAQCVAASGGSSSDIAVITCGDRMGICTSENIFWPHSYNASATYTEPYDTRWQRYADIIRPVSRWQDITRFSIRCSVRFFECTFTLSDSPEHTAVGVCGNYMSICTFQNDVWPDFSQVPTDFDSYSTRLRIYRAMLQNMLYRAPTYFTFPHALWSLYSFSTHNFTNAGATGRFGPTLSACRVAYSSQPWAQNSTLFGMTIQGIQEWMVPRYRGTVERVARCPKLIGLTLRTRPHRRRRRWWMARGRWRWCIYSGDIFRDLEGKDELATLSGDIILIVNDTFDHKGREGLEAAAVAVATPAVVVETTSTALPMAAGKEEGPSMWALTNDQRNLSDNCDTHGSVTISALPFVIGL